MLDKKGVEGLKVFQCGHELTLSLYKLTESFPKEERYGLISQIRRASSSICANLMEGYHRNNTKEYRHFAGIARASAGELKYHLLLSKDLGYLSVSAYEKTINLVNEITKMLYGLIKSLEEK